jgi:hypothetical protein
MSAIQMELFPETETGVLKKEIRDLDDTLGNLRRGMFKRHDELEKKLKELRDKAEKLELALCLIQEKMTHYDAALFPELGVSEGLVSGVVGGLADGVRSTFTPVSFSIVDSATCSTGLFAPQR